MLALENPLNTVPNTIQNSPAIAQQSVQRSDLGPAVDRNAISRGQSRDSFTFSDDARRLAGQTGNNGEAEGAAQELSGRESSENAREAGAEAGASEAESAREAEPKKDDPSGTELTESEREQVEQLKDRDLEVRTHEQAHLSAAGSLANGGPKYEYQTGPDGKRYAVGGHVNIDNSPVSGDPQATIQKMTRVKAAALAPAEPSSQDRKVASDADRKKAQAQQELTQEQLESARQSTSSESPQATAPNEASGGAPASNAAAVEEASSAQGNRPQRISGLANTYGASGIGAIQQESNQGLSIVA